MKIFRILVGFALLLGIVYLSIWGPFFRTWKLQLVGHQVIESNSNLLSSYTSREFFTKAATSPDQKTVAVAINVSRKKYDDNAKTKIALFDLSTGKRLWEIENKTIGTSFYSQFIWSNDGQNLLAFHFSDPAKVIEAKTGQILREIPNLGGCVWLKSKNRTINFSEGFDCKNSKISLLDQDKLSIIWKKPFQEVTKLTKTESMFNVISPNQEMISIWGNQSIKILDTEKKQEKYPEFTTLWSTNSVIWSPDSTMIAIGGDTYAFRGVDGENVQAIKNALVIKLNTTGIQKRRLLTYGEAVRVIGFIENGRKLVGLTETTIIIWDLQK